MKKRVPRSAEGEPLEIYIGNFFIHPGPQGFLPDSCLKGVAVSLRTYRPSGRLGELWRAVSRIGAATSQTAPALRPKAPRPL